MEKNELITALMTKSIKMKETSKGKTLAIFKVTDP
jgi:hypothetical protein